MKKTILTLFCVASVLSSAVYADSELPEDNNLNPLYTGVPSLSIAPDARSGSMGDTGAATTPDIYSQYWNPAKYAFMESAVGFGFSYTPWLRSLVEDINLGYVAGYWKFDDYQAVSASFRFFSMGKVTLRTAADGPIHDAHPNEFAVDVAYSRMLSEKFSASVAFRYIRADLGVGGFGTGGETEMYPADAFAADVSAYYRTPITMATGDAILAFGANISNMGNKISYDDITYNYLPTNLKIGGSFDIPFDSYNRLSVNADVNKLLVISRGGKYGDEFGEVSPLSGIFRSFADSSFGEEMKEITWSVGLEYSYNKQFFARVGYFNEHKDKGGRKYFNAGVGFKLNIFQLDAGYVLATTPLNPLDQTLRFSLSFDLFGLRDLMN
ncbi:hypothetical protein D0T49_06250 [Paludibacter sp. 221]|uniref:type IX secretion system outer membrane channel protein PorV n=1 Tax=Paludibacter sp. 221 TaxID=2302939 RepID=UPI0013D39B34|nr:type IX secretion system outer membrane channel protein PorV [Paludibacter sp. 221]NDV46644.1 hypothetical protein [Paludibacter sp. 221]